MLDSGANPNLSHTYNDYHYPPPLYKAYRNGDMALVNFLLDKGANGEFLLERLGEKPSGNQMIQLLISRGVQVRSEAGASALRWAAYGGNLDAVKLLVENGVNVNARSNDKEMQEYIPLGATAASIAYDKGEMDIYDYLKANGARDFEPRQVAQQPSTPTQSSSTTNVYVQPSAPSQTTSTPAPSTPTLQSGNYAWSNSGTNMTMRLTSTTNTVSAYFNNSPVWSGTYRINGNQIVISVTLASGDYAKMRGQTYSYIITSDTSFSGSGETWVRIGL